MENKNTPLASVMQYKNAFSLVKTFAIVVIAMLCFTLMGIIVYYNFQIEKLTNSTFVLDKATGNLQLVSRELQYDPTTRIYEIDDHVRDFYTLWYQLDEGSYSPNIKKALFLIGEEGKNLLKLYKEENIQQKVKQNNLRTTVQINKLDIDMNKNPVIGKLEGTQTVSREGQETASRHIDVDFSVIDVDRSMDNPHGIKIKDWKIINQGKLTVEEENKLLEK